MAFDSKTAKAAGRKGGLAKGRNNITAENAEAELPPMDSPEYIIRRLEIVATWAAGGAIPGVTAHALTRGAEVALKAFETRLSREITTELRQRLEELETTLKRGSLRVER